MNWYEHQLQPETYFDKLDNKLKHAVAQPTVTPSNEVQTQPALLCSIVQMTVECKLKNTLLCCIGQVA